jgi:hypothetical protein
MRRRLRSCEHGVVVTLGSRLDGPPSLFSVAFDLGSVGIATDEVLVSGAAHAYALVGERTGDGRWTATPQATAEFTTRVVVYRPDASRANGTVVVEWLNVTGGLDVPAVWMATHRHLIRDGYTWIGVSAQRVGIEGGGVLPGLGLRDSDPERYRSLRHPGDAHAFDLFGGVARALRVALPDQWGLPVERLIATGASQSAFYLTTYINAIDPVDEVFDGFLLQGRAGAGAPIEGWHPDVINPANATDMTARRARIAGRDRIRADGRVPVLVVQSETDVLGALGYLPARQPDGERFRLWEVAGAAHCDTYFLGASPQDSGVLPVADLAALIENAEPPGIPVEVPINSGPQMHYVLQRAFDALDRWIRAGAAPPSAPRLDVDGGTSATDRLGIGTGGVRTPWVDVPTRVLSGLGQPGNLTDLFGTTRPLDPAALRERYPGGRADHAREFAAATRAAVDAGFLLEADVPEIEALGACSWPG